MPARPLGGRLTLVGHGRRDRQVRGPLSVGGEPTDVVVATRRYRGRCCAAIVVVVPRGVVRRRHYSGAAIAFALALYALGASTREVRRRVSSWRIVGAATTAWVTLRRWIAAGRAGGLFVGVTAPDGAWRAIAMRLASVLAAQAPPSARERPLAERAFLGGVRMA